MPHLEVFGSFSRERGHYIKTMMITKSAAVLVLWIGATVSFVLPADRASEHRTARFCGPSNEENDPPLGPVCWSARRRNLITTTVSAAFMPYLVQVSDTSAVAAATETSPEAYMADPGPSFTRATTMLAKEADAAATRVTPQHVAEYNEFGVVKVKNVISDKWIRLLRQGCELAQDEAGPYGEYLEQPTDPGIFFTDLELARRLPLFAAFSLHGPAAAVAGTLMGSQTVRYLYDQLFVKEPGVSTTTPWHQDGGYWRVKGTQVASVFVPLDPVSAEDGLEFVQRSHKWPLHNPQHFADGTPYRGTSLPPMPDIEQMANEKKITMKTFDLEPGDVLVFSAATVHGGPGNWGRALSTRWVGDDAKFWDRPGEGAVPTIPVGLRDGDDMAANPAAFPESWRANSS